MDGEQHRDDCTRPSRAGHRKKRVKQKNGVEGVKGDAGQMVSAEIITEQRPIEHMRQERQWKVIGGEGRRERPLQSIDAQPILEVVSTGQILRIIEANCTEAERLGIDRDHSCGQNQGNAKVLQQASGIFTAPQHGIPLNVRFCAISR